MGRTMALGRSFPACLLVVPVPPFRGGPVSAPPTLVDKRVLWVEKFYGEEAGIRCGLKMSVLQIGGVQGFSSPAMHIRGAL